MAFSLLLAVEKTVGATHPAAAAYAALAEAAASPYISRKPYLFGDLLSRDSTQGPEAMRQKSIDKTCPSLYKENTWSQGDC
jgi:hypothetical protein